MDLPQRRHIRALDLPCCCAIPHRLAAFGTTAVSSWLWTVWTVVLVKVYQRLGALPNHVRAEIAGLENFVLFALFVTTLQLLGNIATLGFCIYINPMWLRHLSRTLWVFWVFTWVVGGFGLLVFIADGYWLEMNCNAAGIAGDCIAWWKNIQTYSMVSVVMTICYIFYAGLTLSSYIHTLHPHIFYYDTDEYPSEGEQSWSSDEDEDHHLRRSSRTSGMRQRPSPGKYEDDEEHRIVGQDHGYDDNSALKRGFVDPYDPPEGVKPEYWSSEDEALYSDGEAEREKEQAELKERATFAVNSRGRGDARGRRSRRPLEVVEEDPNVTPPPTYTSPDRGVPPLGSQRRMSATQPEPM